MSLHVDKSKSLSQMKKRKPAFTPLKDLLTKNHDDRVKDYLTKMEGLTMEEVVHSQSLKVTAPQPKKKL